ncbi:MAG: GNAT family N-acetyltransferase [Caulobacterales bacterium]
MVLAEPKIITVRQATFDDAPACTKILREGWKRAFPNLKRKVDLNVFLAETDGESVLVALRKNRVLGFAGVYLPENFLHHLYVAQRVQRKGVGSLLLRASRDLTGGPISLKTQTTNFRARAFYDHHGFVATQTGDDGMGAWVRLESRD